MAGVSHPRKPLPPLLTLVVAVGLPLLTSSTMAPWLYSAAAVALTFATRQADADGASKTEWHPPADWDVNNLTKALHSEGVYGFIFDSSHTPDDKYGQYNYCNMPHVRRQEYVKPSEEYELKYVELVSAHIYSSPLLPCLLIIQLSWLSPFHFLSRTTPC